MALALTSARGERLSDGQGRGAVRQTDLDHDSRPLGEKQVPQRVAVLVGQRDAFEVTLAAKADRTTLGECAPRFFNARDQAFGSHVHTCIMTARCAHAASESRAPDARLRLASVSASEPQRSIVGATSGCGCRAEVPPLP